MNTTETTLQELDLPQSLNEARQKLLKIPGVDNYVPDTDASIEEIDEGIESMINELSMHLDAENMVEFITYNLALTEEEKAEFFSVPERSPYKSKISLSTDFKEKRQQFLAIGKYLALKYRKSKEEYGMENENTKKASENLRLFNEYSLYNLFGQSNYKFSDRVYGFVGRDKGAMIGNEILELLEDSARQVSSEGEEDVVFKQVLEATEGGNLATAFSFLLNHQGDPQLRKSLESAIERRYSDNNLTRQKLKLLWQIESYRMALGIDLELIYEINGLPKSRVIEENLHQFLERKDLVDEMKWHLKKEASGACARAENAGVPIDFWQVLEERAKFLNLPNVASTTEKLKRKKERVWQEIGEILPGFTFGDLPESFMDAPTRVGASLRAFNATYPNQESRLVNVVILDPRDTEILFAEYSGHEIGHKIHALFLKKAENAGYVPTLSWERLSEPIKEEFSQLLEDQVGKVFRRKKGVSELGVDDAGGLRREWRDFWNAYRVRRQAPYALTQRLVRVKMEEMWLGGKSGELGDDEASKLIDELEPQVTKWYKEGVTITSPNQYVSNNINLENPLDGLVYLLKYIEEPKEEKADINKDFFGMKQAFSERFGEIWIDSPEARVVLFALMAETGRNQDITTYGKFVLEANVEDIKTRLASWGVEKEEL